MAPRRTARPSDVVVTPLDIELLAALQGAGSIVAACSRIAITRDLGMYRLRRLSRAARSPVVVSLRGGSDRGGSTLTEVGRRILRRGVGPLRTQETTEGAPPVNVLRGNWGSAPQPHVDLGGGVSLIVTFAAREGESVRVAIEQEAIVVARSRFLSSARNVIPGTIETVRRLDAMRALLHVRVARDVWLDATVTPRSLRVLGLAKGARVFLYLKATGVAHLE